MVYEITGLGGYPLPLSPPGTQDLAGVKRETASPLQIKVLAQAQPSQTVRTAFAVRQAGNEEMLRFATAVRRSEDRMQNLDAYLSAMERDAAIVVKNYPPFPVDSEERLAYLNSVNGLRQQIEKLMLQSQTDDSTVRKSVFDRVLDGTFAELPQITLPEEFDPATISDREVGELYEQILALREKLAHYREDLHTRFQNRIGGPGISESDSQVQSSAAAVRLSDSAHAISRGVGELA